MRFILTKGYYVEIKINEVPTHVPIYISTYISRWLKASKH